MCKMSIPSGYTLTFKDLQRENPFLLCEGPISPEESQAIENGLLINSTVPLEFYANVIVDDWRENAAVELLDGAAFVIQEHWFQYRARRKQSFQALSSKVEILLSAQFSRRQAAVTILRFLRSRHAHSSWCRFKDHIIKVQCYTRRMLAKRQTQQLRSERETHLALERQEAEVMRLNPMIWVRNLDEIAFDSKIKDIQEKVNRLMLARLKDARTLVEMNAGNRDVNLAMISDIEERQRNLSTIQEKRAAIQTNFESRKPRPITPQKLLTTEDVENRRKATTIEPLIDLTDLIKRKKLAWADDAGGVLVTGTVLYKENVPPALTMKKVQQHSILLTKSASKSCLKRLNLVQHDILSV